MRYLEMADEQKAKEASHAMAVAKGSGKPGDVTQYWESWRVAEDGTAELSIRPENEDLLSADDKPRLVDERDRLEKFKPDPEAL